MLKCVLHVIGKAFIREHRGRRHVDSAAAAEIRKEAKVGAVRIRVQGNSEPCGNGATMSGGMRSMLMALGAEFVTPIQPPKTRPRELILVSDLDADDVAGASTLSEEVGIWEVHSNGINISNVHKAMLPEKCLGEGLADIAKLLSALGCHRVENGDPLH